MALTRQTMTDEQRKSVALARKALETGGVTSSGGSDTAPYPCRRK